MLDLGKRFRQAFDAASRGAERRKYISGLMGVKTGASSYTFADPEDGFVRVRYSASGTLQSGRARNDAQLPHQANLPIKLYRDDDGTLVIAGRDNTGNLAGATGGTPGNAYGVAKHNHGVGSGDLQYVHPALLQERGRVYSAGGMSVTIAPLRYSYNGALETWEGGNLDLSSYQTGTAGEWSWVLVGIDPDTNAAVAAAGTSVSTSTALTLAGLDAISFDNWISLAGVRIKASDTDITDITRYEDAKQWLGPGVDAYLGLSDTPATRSGKGGYLVAVNSGATADEYVELGAKIAAATSKATPVDADNLALADSAASDVLKRLTWANLKATLKTYLDTLYLIAAGVSGGQTWYGGTDAGDSATVEGTSHATKGPVLLNPNGGNVGVRDSSPGVITPSFTYPSAAGVHQVGGQYARLTAKGSTNAGVDLVDSGAGVDQKWALLYTDGGIVRLTSLSDAAATVQELFQINHTTGFFGFGITPQGHVHAHDGTGGMLFVTKTGIVGTAQTIIPNGTGDVVRGLRMNLVAWDGSTFYGGSVSIANGGSYQIQVGVPPSFTDELTFAVAADGSFTVQRTIGSKTWSVALDIVWL